MEEKTEKTFVVANNHPRGQAAVNALQLKSMLTGEKVKAPEMLVEAYPVLQDVSDAEGQRRLKIG
jgi:uncharacterized protein YecE (DUF72 family)